MSAAASMPMMGGMMPNMMMPNMMGMMPNPMMAGMMPNPMMAGMMGMMPHMMSQMMPHMMGMMPGMMMPMAAMMGRMTIEMSGDTMTCKMMPMEGMPMEAFKEACQRMMTMMNAGMPCAMMCGGMMMMGVPAPKTA